MNKEQSQPSQQLEAEDEADHLPPQVKIYNRNYYLRNARQQDLQAEIERQIHELAEKPKMTPSSYIILVQKLEQDINKIYKKQLQDEEHVQFQQFQNIFNELGNFSKIKKEEEMFQIELVSTQLWLLLINYDLRTKQIHKNKITSLFHILFCPYTLKQQEMVALIDHAFPDLQANMASYIEEYPEASQEVLDSEGLIKLWMKIKRNHLCTFAENKKVLPAEELPSFKPQITPKSKQYAKKQLEKYLANNKLDNMKTSKLNQLSGYISAGKQLSYHEILYQRQLEKEKLLKTSRRDMLPLSHNEKALTAQETRQLVDNLYVVKEKKQDIDHSRVKEEQDLKKCTFKPEKTEYRKRSVTPTVRNYGKEVDRLQEGRKKKMKLKQAYNNLGRVKSKNIGPPPSMVQRQKPRLILQIKVADRIVQLKLKGDQEPHLVAKKFVVKYGLEESMIEVLQEVIEQQLAAL